MSTRERSREQMLAIRKGMGPIRSIQERPERLTDMFFRYNKVMLRGCRASIFKHDIIAILEIDGMSIVVP
jgi:hypothetical protein